MYREIAGEYDVTVQGSKTVLGLDNVQWDLRFTAKGKWDAIAQAKRHVKNDGCTYVRKVEAALVTDMRY